MKCPHPNFACQFPDNCYHQTHVQFLYRNYLLNQYRVMTRFLNMVRFSSSNLCMGVFILLYLVVDLPESVLQRGVNVKITWLLYFKIKKATRDDSISHHLCSSHIHLRYDTFFCFPSYFHLDLRLYFILANLISQVTESFLHKLCWL